MAAESLIITQQKQAGSDHGVGGEGRGKRHVVDGTKQKKAALSHMLEADRANYRQKLLENTAYDNNAGKLRRQGGAPFRVP